MGIGYARTAHGCFNTPNFAVGMVYKFKILGASFEFDTFDPS